MQKYSKRTLFVQQDTILASSVNMVYITHNTNERPCSRGKIRLNKANSYFLKLEDTIKDTPCIVLPPVMHL
jgi:hypothetical protein